LSRISDVFRKSLGEGRAALIGFLTGGDPNLVLSRRFCEAVIDGGVDVLELGVPFSDPVADGVTIQASTYRALAAGVKLSDILNLADELEKSRNIPVVLLSYMNPIYRFGVKRFLQEAASSGVDGLVVPDLPVEEADELIDGARDVGIDTIFLASPTTTDERLEKILRASTGFVYLVSLLGVTGVRGALSAEGLELLERVKSKRARPYAAIGFGVSQPEHVMALSERGAEGVIVGSALVKIVEENLRNPNKAEELLRRFTAALREACWGYRKYLSLHRP
jgi:tryptophan synthase alpha chain